MPLNISNPINYTGSGKCGGSRYWSYILGLSTCSNGKCVSISPTLFFNRGLFQKKCSYMLTLQIHSNRCSRLSLIPLVYLWRRDQTELLQEMIDCHIEAIIIKVYN